MARWSRLTRTGGIATTKAGIEIMGRETECKPLSLAFPRARYRPMGHYRGNSNGSPAANIRKSNMSRVREQMRELEQLADDFGCKLEIDATRRGHVKATFRSGTKAAAMVMAKGHGGDHRGRRNNLCRARRHLRELTGKTT